MSFGEAASRAGRRPAQEAACPCGSGDAFGSCCGPVIGGAAAETAEALMRSRYTAFALADAVHLEASWHPRTRPEEIVFDPATVWTGLTILRARGGIDDDTGEVAFRATWRDGDGAGAMTEMSRFTRLRGRWVYLDGEAREPSSPTPRR